MGSKIVKILLALLVLLFNNGLLAVEAADQSPLYSIPFDETDWKYQHALDVLRQGLADAVTLARVVILAGSDCDPSFLRCKCSRTRSPQLTSILELMSPSYLSRQATDSLPQIFKSKISTLCSRYSELLLV